MLTGECNSWSNLDLAVKENWILFSPLLLAVSGKSVKLPGFQFYTYKGA